MLQQRRRALRAAAVMTVAGLALAPFAFGAMAAPSADTAGIDQADADSLRRAAGSVGSIVAVRDGDTVRGFGSGTIGLNSKEEPTADHRLRVASITKSFTATVVLQLAEEGKVGLDAPIAKYLPGLVKGRGIDENKITVRDLLQHTSGLNDYMVLVVFDPTYQWLPPTPEHLVARGLSLGAQSEPGTASQYANINYVILGILVEKLTGHRVGEEYDARINKPLGLKNTTYASAGQKQIEGPHLQGYDGAAPLWLDTTGHEPGVLASAGAIVSTASDISAFYRGLLEGKLLTAESLREMQKTFGDSGYGLGLFKVETECGTAWGHNGKVMGFQSFAMGDGKGRSFFALVDRGPYSVDPTKEFLRLTGEAMCGSGATATAQVPVQKETSLTRADLRRLKEAYAGAR